MESLQYVAQNYTKITIIYSIRTETLGIEENISIISKSMYCSNKIDYQIYRQPRSPFLFLYKLARIFREDVFRIILNYKYYFVKLYIRGVLRYYLTSRSATGLAYKNYWGGVKIMGMASIYT